ncbi:hypothetical protein SUDANB105_07764 [Streptomyces sp. enrichment culture]|uniref:hypothetical protein n=1 Tax=Streptomyces sp. enrichment culture TaxID=1795815 RepID=UPI003F572784
MSAHRHGRSLQGGLYEHFSTDVSYLPDLQARLADLLRSRERLMSAFARASRLSTRVQQLENHLSRHLGQQAWRESGLGASTDIAQLQATITHLEQRETELTRQLDDRQAELEAARAANRELTRALNQRG